MDILYTIPAWSGIAWAFWLLLAVPFLVALILTLIVRAWGKRRDSDSDEVKIQGLYAFFWLVIFFMGTAFMAAGLAGFNTDAGNSSTRNILENVGFSNVQMHVENGPGDFVASRDGDFFVGAFVDLPNGKRGILDVTPR